MATAVVYLWGQPGQVTGSAINFNGTVVFYGPDVPNQVGGIGVVSQEFGIDITNTNNVQALNAQIGTAIRTIATNRGFTIPPNQIMMAGFVSA